MKLSAIQVSKSYLSLSSKGAVEYLSTAMIKMLKSWGHAEEKQDTHHSDSGKPFDSHLVQDTEKCQTNSAENALKMRPHRLCMLHPSYN